MLKLRARYSSRRERNLTKVGSSPTRRDFHDFTEMNGRLTRCLYGFLRECLHGHWLITLRVEKFVVHYFYVLVIIRQQADLIRNRLRIRERGDILPDVRKAHLDVLRVAPRKLGFALLTQHNDVEIASLLCQEPPRCACHARVDATTEPLVGAANHEQRLLVFGVLALGGALGRLGLVEDRVGSFTVGTGLDHGALGAGELGRGHDLHGLGDLFDVADGLEAAFDFAEGGLLGLCRGEGTGSESWSGGVKSCLAV